MRSLGTGYIRRPFAHASLITNQVSHLLLKLATCALAELEALVKKYIAVIETLQLGLRPDKQTKLLGIVCCAQ